MTIRPPSDTAQRMPPLWTGVCEISSLAFTTDTLSSAPTKQQMSPRKCTEVTACPSGSGRTLSVTDTMEADSPGSNSFITW